MDEMDNPMIPPHLRPTRQDLEEAERTLYMLADQFGIRCAQCGTSIRGHEQIGAICYMAPMGTKEYQARAYCEDCAEGMRGE